jgi:hypothetical protein
MAFCVASLAVQIPLTPTASDTIMFLSGGPGLRVLDEPYSAKPAQRSSHTGPPGYLGGHGSIPAYVE